jgi:hypothetical protein
MADISWDLSVVEGDVGHALPVFVHSISALLGLCNELAEAHDFLFNLVRGQVGSQLGNSCLAGFTVNLV